MKNKKQKFDCQQQSTSACISEIMLLLVVVDVSICLLCWLCCLVYLKFLLPTSHDDDSPDLYDFSASFTSAAHLFSNLNLVAMNGSQCE
ncbi:CLUMA_CG013998, isoform A [Clunio marinus]|uniref:CLUMA_CG013998, isoform A n=1 Tax=Clunio marinus TaxID=568069 RepID=A0A1J1INS0_9DIPT|nr:CLUMA_CG013998, isoform A [Clunio marinus]